MNLLNWPVEEVLPSRRAQQHRRRVVFELFNKFSSAFPEVTYELLWESPSVNAQAWRLGPACFVRVYGGLVRHPAMTKYGLALMLAHETGHHYGGPPFDPAVPWISSQGQADYWASSVGMKKVYGPRALYMTERGAEQLRELYKAFTGRSEEDEPALSVECRHEIFLAGARGAVMPDCAKKAFCSE